MNLRKSLADKFLATALALIMTVSLAACNGSGVNQVLSDIDLIAQTATVVCSAIAIANPADATACSKVASVAAAEVPIIQAAYNAYIASGAQTDLAKLQAALAALKTDLPAALAAANILDPAVLATVTNWVNLVVGVVNDVIALIPQLQAATPSKRAALVAGLPTVDALKTQWDTQVCKGSAACAGLVTVHHLGTK